MSDHAPTADGHGDGGHGHGHEPAFYIKVWAALCVLLAVSVAGPWFGDNFMEEGSNARTILVLITAFGIACVKAGMVIHYFMHLTDEPRFVHYFLVTSVVFMGLFFAAVAPDVMNHAGDNWVNYAAEQAVIDGMEYGDPADHHSADEGGEGDHGSAAAGGH